MKKISNKDVSLELLSMEPGLLRYIDYPTYEQQMVVYNKDVHVYLNIIDERYIDTNILTEIALNVHIITNSTFMKVYKTIHDKELRMKFILKNIHHVQAISLEDFKNIERVYLSGLYLGIEQQMYLLLNDPDTLLYTNISTPLVIYACIAEHDKFDIELKKAIFKNFLNAKNFDFKLIKQVVAMDDAFYNVFEEYITSNNALTLHPDNYIFTLYDNMKSERNKKHTVTLKEKIKNIFIKK